MSLSHIYGESAKLCKLPFKGVFASFFSSNATLDFYYYKGINCTMFFKMEKEEITLWL